MAKTDETASEVPVDHLTGLRTRDAFEHDVEASLSDAQRSLLPFSVVFVDIDHFKRVNDTHGHATGDQVLKETARVVLGVAEHKGRVYRVGGEEMVILLANHDRDEALAVAERARREIEKASIGGICVTASLGVATFPEHGKNSAALVKAADGAMYDAKERGRNLVRYSSEPEPSAEPTNPKRPATRRLPEPGRLSEDRIRFYRTLHLTRKNIPCPRDQIRMRVRELNTTGGTDLLAECPMCGNVLDLPADEP